MMRGGDRFYSAMLLLAAAALIAAVPVCAAIGSVSYTAAADAAHAEKASKHTVDATIMSTQPPHLVRYSSRMRAEIGWSVGDVEFLSTQQVSGSARPGEVVTIWVDAAGNRVDPPPSPAAAAAKGIWSAAGSFALLAAAAVVGLRLMRLCLTLRYSQRWSREWATLDAAHADRRS